MLSILIPTYNYVCAHLVCELQKQCEEVQASLGEEAFRYEIIVADDASTDDEAVSKNAVIEYLPNCRYLDSERNVGRAAIRNRLAKAAHHPWLLFMDADAEVIDDDFIANYLNAIRQHPDVDAVVGGIIHPDACPSPQQTLRHRYEKEAEARFCVERRQQEPFAAFRTFNFAIRRTLCLAHPFDDNITQYGYEDVLFGMELMRDNANILHIDNPLQNGDIEDNATYLRKIETALKTLHTIEDVIGSFSPILIIARRLRKIPLAPQSLRFIFRLCRPMIRRNLLSAHPNLHLFAFYKLGYYLSL